MKILIVAALYPPDPGEIAAYTKELAGRLAKSSKVTVLTFAELPEKISGVETRSVAKKSSLNIRIFNFWLALRQEIQKTDALYIVNGPSVELPILGSDLSKKRTLFFEGDLAANRKVSSSFWLKLIRNRIAKKSKNIESRPISKPEILPFSEYPHLAFVDYEDSWQEHIKEIQALLKNVQ